jgi:hypothetical protein
MIGGLIGFRRLRPGVQWRLFSVHACNDAGANTQGASLEEFEPKGPGDMPRCIREFCSPNMPQLIERKDKGGGRSDFLLPGGPVGRQAAFDPVFGYINRGLPRYRTPTDESGSAVTMVTLPVGALVFDLIVHRDFLPMTPEVHVYGYPEGGPIGPATHTEQHRLPCNDRPVELAGSPPAVYTPMAPGATRMLERVFARLGVNPSEFRGWRLQIRHPPMSSIYILRWPLGAQPG